MGQKFLMDWIISNADSLKPYLILINLRKGPEYGPQGMMAHDLLNYTNTTLDLSDPCRDLLVMDLVLIPFTNNPMPKNT